MADGTPRRLPTLGAALVITNPLRAGYLAYLAAAEAYAGFCDELVIIDGGSADGSVHALLEWLQRGSHSCDTRVVQDEETHWGESDGWHWAQIMVNLNRALQELTCDWAFVFGADYVGVSSIETSESVRRELAELGDAWWVMSRRGKPIDGRIVHDIDTRNVIINLKKARESGVRLGFGLASTGLFSDWPLVLSEKASFRDPVTGIWKECLRGEPVEAGGSLALEFIAYGHFFYTLEQVDSKVLRWERAVSRFTGDAPARLGELRLRHGVHSIVGFRDKEDVLSWGHPPEMERVIREYYRPGMVGGAIRRIGRFRAGGVALALQAYRLERKMRTLARRVVGVKGERAELEWQSLE